MPSMRVLSILPVFSLTMTTLEAPMYHNCTEDCKNLAGPVIGFWKSGFYSEYKSACEACDNKDLYRFYQLRACPGPDIIADCFGIIGGACGILADGTLIDFNNGCEVCYHKNLVHAFFDDYCPTQARTPFRHYCQVVHVDTCDLIEDTPVLAVSNKGEKSIFESNCDACSDTNHVYYLPLKACYELPCIEDLNFETCGMDSTGAALEDYANSCEACEAGKKYYLEGKCSKI